MLKCLLMSFATVIAYCAVSVAQSESTGVVGTWEGESTCTVQPSACHDEHVIYDITRKEQKLVMSADKVVNGQRQNMGTLDCSMEGKTLRCPMPRGVWSFEANGTKMTGELKLADGTLFRKVEVEKKRTK